MDSNKISLWLLLAIISVYKSECKSFHNYLVSTSETSNEHDDNCFCFKNPGDHQIVPEILNQNNHNLERHVIYLYKDKITGQVKMYMPNEEKQALIPDLAFEVGDKLVTVDDDKIINIFPHTKNAHEANIVLPKEQNEFQYDDNVEHVPQIDRNGVLSQENTPDIYHTNSHEYYIDTDSVQAEKHNKPSDVMYDNTLIKQPQVYTNRKPTKVIEIIPEHIYGGHDSSEASFEKLISSKTNDNDFEADAQPANHWNILPDYTNHGQHELPSVDYNRVPDEIMYPDNAQYANPYIVTNGVLKPLKMPNTIDHKVNYHVQYEHPDIETIGVSKQIFVPGKVMYPDNINYHELQKQPHVDTISVLDPLYVKGKATYEQPYVDANSVSKQINVPSQAIYDNNLNYHGQHKNPYIDYMKVSKKTNVPLEVMYPDNFNYHEQHEQPHTAHIDTNGVSKQPNVPGKVKYPYGYYYVQHEHLLPETNDETEPINVPGEYTPGTLIGYNSGQGIPSKSSEHTFIMDGKPDGNWNIPSAWIYKHTIDPHRYGKEYVDIIHGSDKNTNHVPLKSSEESEETGSSVEHKSKEAIAESGSDQKVDSSEEYNSKGGTENENNSIKYSQSIENDSSQENEMVESREVVKDSNELEINAVIAGPKKDKMNPRNHSKNQYATFDKWFIQQMQRFQTFTEHDKAINIVNIERYILNILYDNGMHVTSEGVLTDSYGTALDVHKLHLRPILIGDPLAVGSILKQTTTDLVMPANMAYLQAILVTNAKPSMILGIIPIGKTVIPPSAKNTFSTILKPHFRHDSSVVLAKHPTLASTYQTQISLGEPVLLDSGRHSQPKSTNHRYVNKKNKSGNRHGETVVTFVKETPVIVHHRHRQPVKSVKIHGAEGEEVNFISKNSAEAVNKLMSSLSGPEGPLSSADATNKLLDALRSDGSLFSSSEESHELDVDEDDIAGKIVGGSAATGSGAPLSMKGRMKDF